ncbi:MAG: DeoR/GlpR transcriptional regulator [Clostridia bacterium]|nr:DeoR/GlpR transcriptional regulator [Clostridia bacterium]
MSKNSRSEEILQLVNSRGVISVAELSKKTYSSRSTIRRDLEKLEQQGLLRRHHGGAESVLSLRPPQIIRRQRNQSEKNAIAYKAAALVEADSTIFIDASTTVQYMIPYLAAVEHLTVYTNGVDTAMRLAEAKIRTVCTGGELLSESLAYVGSAAINTVRKVYFDAMFFSSAGFDDDVVSDWSEGETELRRVVLEQSAKRYFLADYTKRGERYTHIVCRTNELDKIICE